MSGFSGRGILRSPDLYVTLETPLCIQLLLKLAVAGEDPENVGRAMMGLIETELVCGSGWGYFSYLAVTFF